MEYVKLIFQQKFWATFWLAAVLFKKKYQENHFGFQKHNLLISDWEVQEWITVQHLE